jgi:hypothetical protein
VPTGDQSIKESANQGKRRKKSDVVGHECARAVGFKIVIVRKRAEWAFNHGVLKIFGRPEGSDAHPHLPPNPKVFGFPFNVLTLGNQTGGHAGNCVFLGRRRRPYMKIDAAGKIEAPLKRRTDRGL